MNEELRLYQPGNGSEGEGFFCRFCYECERDRAFQDEESSEGCEILLRTMLYKVTDPEYPREWRYNDQGEPVCTAFVPLGGRVPTDAEAEAEGQATLWMDPGQQAVS